MKKIIVTLFSVMMIFLSSCGSTAEVSEAATTTEKSSSVKETKSDKNLYKGAGLVIAVTAPEVRNGGKAESWMPQFFQDSITGNLAKYSKMTVLDRANEDLTKAEQELGETGFYTEENAVQLGQMTNAQYAVFGSITALSTSYELNFRAIDITTNEIKAAYNDRAGSKEIEDGTSVRAIITELLDGLGIGLSEKEKAQLAKTDKKSLNATKSLAKGVAAEKADNLIEALAFYAEAQENGATKKEASAEIDSILGTNGTVSGDAIANLKAQAEYEKQQEAKWKKIRTDFYNYCYANAFIIVYDFSQVESKLDSSGDSISLSIMPGIKIIPNRKALFVAKKIHDEWDKIKSNPQNANRLWVRRMGDCVPNTLSSSVYQLKIGLFDETGYCITEKRVPDDAWGLEQRDIFIDNLKSQKMYFNDEPFKKCYIGGISLSKIPDDGELLVKPIELTSYGGGKLKVELPIMSIDEYNEWAREQ